MSTQLLSAETAKRCFTPPSAGHFLGIGPEKVIRFIKSGELRASNVTERVGGRPKWRITPEALEAFLRSREPVPEEAGTRRSKGQ